MGERFPESYLHLPGTATGQVGKRQEATGGSQEHQEGTKKIRGGGKKIGR